MKAYKTYETFAECKLAHPKCDVFCSYYDNKFSPEAYTDRHFKCKPSDYLMSMEEFLVKGFELVGGDLYVIFCGKVIKIDDAHCAAVNTPSIGDKERYILKAKALDSCTSHGIASIQSASGHIESINDYPIEQVLRGLETEVKSAAGHPSSSAKLYKACLDMLSAIDGERLTQRAYGFYCEFHGEQSIDFDEWVQDEDQRAPWEFMVKRGEL